MSETFRTAIESAEAIPVVERRKKNTIRLTIATCHSEHSEQSQRFFVVPISSRLLRMTLLDALRK